MSGKCQSLCALCCTNTHREADVFPLGWSLGTHIVQVGELDLDRGGQESRVGFNNHSYHLGVEQGGVTVREEHISLSKLDLRCVRQGNKNVVRWSVNIRYKTVKLPLEGHNWSKVSVEDNASHKGIIAIWKWSKIRISLKYEPNMQFFLTNLFHLYVLTSWFEW